MNSEGDTLTKPHAGCDLFVTNDRRFKSTRSMRADYLTWRLIRQVSKSL